MLWLVNRNPRGRGGLQFLLTAARKTGCRIVEVTPDEQALLNALGFGSGRVQ